MKDRLAALFRAALDDIAVDRVMLRDVRVDGRRLLSGGLATPLPDDRPVHVFAYGKAAGVMAATFVELLGGRRAEGVIVAPSAPARPLAGFEPIAASHPYPDRGSVEAAEILLRRAAGLGEDDLVVHLVSGGGSALVEAPIDASIGLDDTRAFYELLVTCGADIVVMNVLRKHFSKVKGGRLAVAASPARQLTLYVCDVPSAHPSAVASGPTMPDESTLADCARLVERLSLREKLPAAHRALLDGGRLPETPKPGDPLFARCAWHRLVGTEEGVAALADRARAEGFVVETDLSVDDLPVDDALEQLLARLASLRAAHAGRRVAVVTGGELSCPVTGDGRGGRNQAFVLRAAERIAGTTFSVLSGGTDGIDGNSPAAGAVADGSTIERAATLGMDPRAYDRRSDSWTFFSALGDDVTTGPTGNNVRDLRILAAEA